MAELVVFNSSMVRITFLFAFYNDLFCKLLFRVPLKIPYKFYGIINFFYSTRAGCYINTEMVQCDYYDYLQKYGFDRVPVGYLEEFDWASKNY